MFLDLGYILFMASKPRYYSKDYYYHIYNCGVEKRKVFINLFDYNRFLEVCGYYITRQGVAYAFFKRLTDVAKETYLGRMVQANLKGLLVPRVSVVAYVLMPNHFHFLLKQAIPGGIESYMADVLNSYTRYFNVKNTRLGSLFQGTYKAKEIRSEESLLQVSRYIHLNPLGVSIAPYAGGLLDDIAYSSYRSWVKDLEDALLDKNELGRFLSLAGGYEKYKDFVESKMSINSSSGIESLTFGE